jgi:leader peptidase (prepilin peptidase)/N-methyltransferase
MVIILLLSFVAGLAIGSFISAYTYRTPKEKSVKVGRSFCPKCKEKIAWYDNIPLISYLFLKGKCRRCQKKISIRYPLVEFATAFLFVLVTYYFFNCGSGVLGGYVASIYCSWRDIVGVIALPFLLVVVSVLVSVFVVDFENNLIFDSNVFLLFAVTAVLLIFSPAETLYTRFLTGFSFASFLLLIHLLTKGKGMGLGDVKLAIPLGMILDWRGSFVWMFLSFVIGAVVGLVLIFLKKAKFGRQIPFGPFLVASFFLALFCGHIYFGDLFPYLTLFK